MNDLKTYTFKKREIVLMFLLMFIGGAVIFAIGIKIGQNLLESDCQNVLDSAQIAQKVENAQAEPPADQVSLPLAEEKNKETEKKAEKEPTEELAIKEVTSEIKGKYTIQVGAYDNEAEAKKEAEEFYNSGYKLAYYMEADIPNKGTWYRVGIGFFEKQNSAKVFAEMLKKQGKIPTYLIKKVD